MSTGEKHVEQPPNDFCFAKSFPGKREPGGAHKSQRAQMNVFSRRSFKSRAVYPCQAPQAAGRVKLLSVKRVLLVQMGKNSCMAHSTPCLGRRR